ncbi:MAG TPA: isoprenylcysteine carboxylmethyltransferase family protein [Thermoanaerobaculia bacterium]|jgi:protein-S-isoprenylcysteine O-methyltransferase Ste14
MNSPRVALPGVVAALAFVALLGGLLFGSAGRTDVPAFWAYLGVWAITMVPASFLVDPTLAAERASPGPGGQDYGMIPAVGLLWLVQHVSAGLDVGRYHWSDGVSPVLRTAALVAVAGGLVVMVWAMEVNRFFSSVIRIQRDRGHHVVTGGPYRWVRHPGYAAAPFLLVGSGLALGSWIATALGLFFLPLLVRRTVREDRILREQLEGYAAYAERVRWRILPGVW